MELEVEVIIFRASEGLWLHRKGISVQCCVLSSKIRSEVCQAFKYYPRQERELCRSRFTYWVLTYSTGKLLTQQVIFLVERYLI